MFLPPLLLLLPLSFFTLSAQNAVDPQPPKELAAQNSDNANANANANANVNVADELLFVQALWRHGDRSPTDTFKSDPNQEDKWPQGWGQLTTRGMAQHVVLGQKLRQKYITERRLLGTDGYRSAELYVRSTDMNRTLTSALSNMVGFFGAGRAGADYPGSPDPAPWWPAGYVPVAVHTVDQHNDHIIPDVPDADCPRQGKLRQMIRRTPEYRKLMEEKKWLFDVVTEQTGQRFEFDDWWQLADTLFIEDLYERELGLEMPPWTRNQTIRAAIREVDDLFSEWNDGKDLAPLNGVKFDEELARIRGGPMLWILIDNMRAKLQCSEPSDQQQQQHLMKVKSPFGSPICHWIGRKKYFAYSAHDTTIAALFAAFGFLKTNYDTEGLPHYSACVTVELWRNATDQQPYVKAFYWPPNEPGVVKTEEEITQRITGCPPPATDAAGCPLEQFIHRSLPFQPTPSADAYCQNTEFPEEAGGDGNGAMGIASLSSMMMLSMALGSTLLLLVFRL